MKNKTQNSIKTVSSIILAISIFMTFSNLGGAFVSEILDIDIPFYFILCITSAFIGVVYSFGSYSMLKGKIWSRSFLLNFSRFIILSTIIFSIFAFFVLPLESDVFVLKIASVVALIIFGLPLFFLISFLQSEKVKLLFASQNI
jgi:hypothetical protein